MLYLAKAINNLRPDSRYSFKEEDYSTIQFSKIEGNPPTQNEIDTEINRIKSLEQAEAAAKATQKAALLAKLGITADEAALLLS
jgi:hypothetical protein